MASFEWNGSTSTNITDQANWGDGASGFPGNGDDVTMNLFGGSYYPWNFEPASIDTTWASLTWAGFNYDIGTFEGALTLISDNSWGGPTITANDRTNAVTYTNNGDGAGGVGDGIVLAGTWNCTMDCNGDGSSYINNTGTFGGTLNLNTGGVDLWVGDTYGGTVNVYAVNLYSATFTTCNWHAGTIQNSGGLISMGTCYMYVSLDATPHSSGNVEGTFRLQDDDLTLSFPDTAGTKTINTDDIDTTQYNIFGTIL